MSVCGDTARLAGHPSCLEVLLTWYFGYPYAVEEPEG